MTRPARSLSIPGGAAPILGGLAVAALVAACDGPPKSAASTDVTIRVEDGVTIVEHAGLHVADSTSWSIDAEPFFSIGSLEGDADYLFGRVVGVASLPTGEIVVADGQTMQLRLFDENGRFLRTVGRQGEGPGEFYEMSDVRRVAGDSVVVLNRHGRRVHLLDPDLEFVRRTHPMPTGDGVEPEASSASTEGVFGDGPLLMSEYMRGCGFPAEGVCMDSARYFRTDLEGRVLAAFGQRSHGRMVFTQPDAGPQFAFTWPHPQPMWTTGPDGRFYYVAAPTREILVFAPDGELERRIVLGGSAPEWTRAELFPRPPTWGGRDGIDTAALASMYERLRTSPLPDTFPTFADVAVDPDGWLWLREYLPPGPVPDRAPRWFVFDAEGRLRHAVRAPPGVTSMWDPTSYRAAPLIERSRIFAVTTDELGVERVVGYRVEGRE